MVELNLTNFITVGVIAMLFMSIVEVVKHKVTGKKEA